MDDNIISFTEIKDEIAKGTRLFKAFEKGEKVLNGLASLEQRAKELQERTDRLLAKAQELADRNGALEAGIEEMETKAKAIVYAAEREKNEILMLAKAEADGMLEAARKSADLLKDQMDADLAALEDIQAKVGEERLTLQKIVEQKQAALKAINKALGD